MPLFFQVFWIALNGSE
jgi:hypothetical protein